MSPSTAVGYSIGMRWCRQMLGSRLRHFCTTYLLRVELPCEAVSLCSRRVPLSRDLQHGALQQKQSTKIWAVPQHVVGAHWP